MTRCPCGAMNPRTRTSDRCWSCGASTDGNRLATDGNRHPAGDNQATNNSKKPGTASSQEAIENSGSRADTQTRILIARYGDVPVSLDVVVRLTADELAILLDQTTSTLEALREWFRS